MAAPLRGRNSRSILTSAGSDDDGSALAACLLRPFVSHPAFVGETYRQHLRFAARIGGRNVGGGRACLVHDLLPFLLQTTGSQTVRKLHQWPESGRLMVTLQLPDDETAVPSPNGGSSLPC